jgi:hypothetical protein
MKKYAPFILSGCLLIALSFLMPENICAQPAGNDTSRAVTGITPGRAKSLAGGVIALISLIAGWRAKKARPGEPARSRNKRMLGIISLSLAGIAIILSLAHLSTSAGAVFGSGSGKAGAIVTLALALIGATLGGLSLRSK